MQVDKADEVRDPICHIGKLYSVMVEGEVYLAQLVQYAHGEYRLVNVETGNRLRDHDVEEIDSSWIDVTHQYVLKRV